MKQMTPAEQAMLCKALSVSFIGTPDTVRSGPEKLVATTNADEPKRQFAEIR